MTTTPIPPALTPYRVQPWPAGRGYTRYRAQRACHRNAWYLACDHPDLLLVKGYALRAEFGMWVGHWWCVDAAGGVVDPTWKNAGDAYVGLEVVDRVEFAREIRERGMFEVGVDNVAHPDLAAALHLAAKEKR